ncbi:MAG: tetratricopeptide repeat protein [Planctomycetota bacterium]
MLPEGTGQEELRRLAEELERNPGSARAHLRLGTMLQKARQGGEAERHLRRAVELDPDLYEAWVNLGGVLFARWDFAGSAEISRKAVACRPTAVQAHYNLGLACLYMGQAAEVVDCFRRVVELDPENAGGHYYLAAGLNSLGKVAAAKLSLLKSESLGFHPEPELIRAIDDALRKEGGEGVLTMEIGDGPEAGKGSPPRRSSITLNQENTDAHVHIRK